MPRPIQAACIFLALAVGSFMPLAALGEHHKPKASADAAPRVLMVEQPADPHGSPRPAPKSQNVPLTTSIFIQLGVPEEAKDDAVAPESVVVRLQADGAKAIDLLQSERRFAKPASGWLRPGRATTRRGSVLFVYIEPGMSLKPGTNYTVRVEARSKKGGTLPETDGIWAFTTEAASKVHALKMPLDLGAKPVQWHGQFFSGICNVVFCTSAEGYGPTYDLMNAVRKQHPRAWSFQRDFWMTGSDGGSSMHILPNVACERETRRITAVEKHDKGVLLRVEDFFGHQQYGIPSNRPLSGDYHVGDEVLVADSASDARSKVLAVDDQARTVLIGSIATPEGGWKIAYQGALPTKEDPDAPGLFAPGGCYLRKFSPHGTPCYYWGRLDKEWDLIHRRCGRRLLVNFADTPWDFSMDGRSWNTAKDYVEWHDVVRTITNHLIDRYGDGASTFTYSIFNEPDLSSIFWRASWDELQRFYDYTTDAILRTFEDRGYDSSKIFIGGLELGAVFGKNMKLEEFLAHCSPRASAPGALEKNAAFIDHRLDGKRSRRVETLCRQHGGKGSPCDFISVHSYNRSNMMAEKIIRAKDVALEIDPQYYRDLWVSSHENCPDWTFPPDEAAGDSYLGNGYFPSWCIDVVARLLGQAQRDPRYAFGESVLTVWPPVHGLSGTNTVTRILGCDDNGDGKADRQVTIASPIFHVMTLLSDFGSRYWVLPVQQIGGHEVGGFASRDEKNVIRVALYSHDAADTQSRSESTFDVALDLSQLGWKGPARVEECRFDSDHNSYFREAKSLRKRPAPRSKIDPAKLDATLRALESTETAVQLAALKTMETLGPAAVIEAVQPIMKLAEEAKDKDVRRAARKLVSRSFLGTGAPQAYTPDQVAQFKKLSECRPTGSATYPRQADGHLHVTARVAGNGLNILLIEPAAKANVVGALSPRVSGGVR